jgi:DNA-binding LacI/PurR family transcriptional regulator
VGQENILIPLAPDSRDLKALHHAISLAERINSKIIVFSLEAENSPGRVINPVMEACKDVINRVRENDMDISLLITSSQGEEAEKEFLQLLTRERIDLIIISDTERYMEQMIRRVMPLISCQVEQVKEKNHIRPFTS